MLPMTKEFKEFLRCLLDWAIDAYRNHLNSPRSANHTLFAITLLTMAEMMYLRYAQHLPEDLRAAAGGVGHRALKVMFAIPVLGVIVIRIAEIFTVTQSVGFAICLVVISIMPMEILHAVMYLVSMARNWMSNSEAEERDETESAPLPEQTDLREGHFTSAQARLRSIRDTMCFVIENSAIIVLFLEPVRTVTVLVVTPFVEILKWIMCTAHRRLRSRDHPESTVDDTNLGAIPV